MKHYKIESKTKKTVSPNNIKAKYSLSIYSNDESNPKSTSTV